MVAGDDRLRPVWQNEDGGLTFELTGDGGRRFVKWVPAGSTLDLAAEVDRLRWAGTFITVPRVLDSGTGADGSWLLTAALPGQNAVTERWRREPVTAATAIGRGLRALHDRLPVEDCPFTWSAADRLQKNRAARHHEPSRWHPAHAHLGLDEVVARLSDPPSIDRLVVCHGDACAPNTLIGEDGDYCGHVDLGALGTADRWADLAIATWSLDWNYGLSGPDLQPVLLQAYGIDPDPERTAFYRLLWDLSP
jgi:kanamycin kinase